MKTHIREDIKLGELFHSLVLSRKDLFKIVTKPAFALIVLTVVPPPGTSGACKVGGDDLPPHVISRDVTTTDALTREVLKTINDRGEIFLTSTLVDGLYAIRVVCAIPSAKEKYIREAFNIMVKTTEEVMGKHTKRDQHREIDTCKGPEKQSETGQQVTLTKHQRPEVEESVLDQQIGHDKPAAAFSAGSRFLRGLKKIIQSI